MSLAFGFCTRVMLDDSCNSGFHYPADLLPWCPFLYFPVECRRSLKLMPSPQLQISPQTDLHTVVSCDGKPSKDYLMPDLCRRTRSSEMWLEARILSSIPFSPLVQRVGSRVAGRLRHLRPYSPKVSHFKSRQPKTSVSESLRP